MKDTKKSQDYQKRALNSILEPEDSRIRTLAYNDLKKIEKLRNKEKFIDIHVVYTVDHHMKPNQPRIHRTSKTYGK